MNPEFIIPALAVCSMVAVLQAVAWKLNKNGKVFALTSTVIGGVVGAFIGSTL